MTGNNHIMAMYQELGVLLLSWHCNNRGIVKHLAGHNTWVVSFVRFGSHKSDRSAFKVSAGGVRLNAWCHFPGRTDSQFQYICAAGSIRIKRGPAHLWYQRFQMLTCCCVGPQRDPTAELKHSILTSSNQGAHPLAFMKVANWVLIKKSGLESIPYALSPFPWLRNP